MPIQVHHLHYASQVVSHFDYILFGVEIKSHVELPVNEWTFLTFVFRNLSHEDWKKERLMNYTRSQGVAISGPSDVSLNKFYKKDSDFSEGYNFTTEMYINGRLDVKVSYAHKVLSNNASLELFKDVSFNG